METWTAHNFGHGNIYPAAAVEQIMPKDPILSVAKFTRWRDNLIFVLGFIGIQFNLIKFVIRHPSENYGSPDVIVPPRAR